MYSNELRFEYIRGPVVSNIQPTKVSQKEWDVIQCRSKTRRYLTTCTHCFRHLADQKKFVVGMSMYGSKSITQWYSINSGKEEIRSSISVAVNVKACGRLVV